MYPPGLSIIVPAYNEEATLADVAAEVAEGAKAAAHRYEIIIVDDGSQDGTPAIARRLAAERADVRVVTHDTNTGSGAAIRTGIRAAQYEFVTYVPADGQFPACELRDFMEMAQHADVVLGVRDGRPDYTLFRRFSSKVYTVLVNALFSHRFRDVNWVNLWRHSILDDMELRSHGVFLMEEIVCKAHLSAARVVELPAGQRPRQAGRAKGGNIGTILTTLNEMARVWIEVHSSRWKPVRQTQPHVEQTTSSPRT